MAKLKIQAKAQSRRRNSLSLELSPNTDEVCLRTVTGSAHLVREPLVRMGEYRNGMKRIVRGFGKQSDASRELRGDPELEDACTCRGRRQMPQGRRSCGLEERRDGERLDLRRVPCPVCEPVEPSPEISAFGTSAWNPRLRNAAASDFVRKTAVRSADACDARFLRRKRDKMHDALRSSSGRESVMKQRIVHGAAWETSQRCKLCSFFS